MQNLYSAKQSKQMDNTSIQDFSIPESVLMEDASLSAYDKVLCHEMKKAKSVLFVAGGGNNGGDALALARLASLDGATNLSILLADSGKETELRMLQRKICEKMGLHFTTEVGNPDLIIDGLFGIGLSGEPREPYRALIEKINERGAKVISLDVPSGMGDTVPFGCSIQATQTVCMGELKKALYHPKNRDYAGTIAEIPLHIFPQGAKPETDTHLLEFSDISDITLQGSAYKKTRGHIAVIGGSGHFSGAAVLAAKAAFHCGAGLVTIFTEEKLIAPIVKAIPSAMVTSYENIPDLSTFDAVLIGPGMGTEHDSLLETALKQAKRLVIDADAIRALARLHGKDPQLKANDNCILTPHLGEYAELVKAFAPDLKQDTVQDWEETLKTVQKATGATIAVKANTVWICNTEGIFICDGQNPSLGVAGSGDVLAGITVALCAQTCPNAAQSAVLRHQKAGQLAHGNVGMYSSDDLINFIGKTQN